ncbi:TonB-dependent receptor [Phenylobacterium sp.]|jgi:iron complex outermembrane receptor protein|uniref:TonB-dependent receptor n=1 Tax=Phenylobacterium sp. TaxID=1871053 RepID=UPI003783AA7A
MNMKLSRALCATTALVTGLLMAEQALAQSTGTAVLEELIVTGTAAPRSVGGAIVAETEPKSRASITEELITRQTPGQTILDAINLLPAVTFSNNDPYGSAGGDITMRGFDSQRVALLADGVPLNDSGNYEIYPNQQLDSDLIERATVNLGTTDVDSPTAAAAGGTINYITRKASDVFGVRAEVGAGSDNFQRYYATIETGAIGPFGTKAWVSGLFTRNDLFKPHNSPIDPKGKIQKKQFNARIDQDFGSAGWASLILNYNENRNQFINRINLATFRRQGLTTTGAADTTLVGATTCTRPTPAAGTAQVDNTTNCPSGFYGFTINPSNTGNIRGLSSWNLADNLTLTVDPSFQYTIANGGGIGTFSENLGQLRGNSTAAGVDLNGDGDLLDTVHLYRPNTTNTRRYGLTSSLIWKFADNQSVRAAYTFDRARHRQTGQLTYLTQDGFPTDVFGGKDGYGEAIDLPDGSILRRRDRYSIALLNQVSVEYRGRFLEDRLLVNLGLRAPFFKRELNNFCYQRSTFDAYCTTERAFVVTGTDDGSGRPYVVFPSAGNGLVGGAGTGTQALTAAQRAAFLAFYGLPATSTVTASQFYGQPRSFQRKYDDVLPNVGVSYDLTDDLTVFASYAETLSAPRTDDLYDRDDVDPGPERSKSYDLGVRYQTGMVLAAASIWRTDFSNRIERVLDEAAGIAFSQNVGDVKLQGFDAQIGITPTEELSFYASYSFIDSELQNDIPGTSATAPVLRTKGNELYEVPKHQGAARVQYDPTEFLSLGAQAKWVGDRWTNLTNDEKTRGFGLLDLDARFKLDSFGLERTYVQLNVRNATDKRFLNEITENLSGTALAQPGYRRTFIVTLHAEF